MKVLEMVGFGWLRGPREETAGATAKDGASKPMPLFRLVEVPDSDWEKRERSYEAERAFRLSGKRDYD